MTKYLWLMVGPPGSGKTTAAKTLFDTDTIYVSRDEIRFSMLEPDAQYFSRETEVFNEFVRRIQEGLATGKPVIADATHLKQKNRWLLIHSLHINPSDTLEVNAIVTNTPLEIAIQRNEMREGLAKVPSGAIINMYRDYRDPKNDTSVKYKTILYINENQEVIDTYHS